MSPYSENLERRHLLHLQQRIEEFARRYQASASPRHGAVFLFPGGFASQLVRAEQAGDHEPPFNYDLLWLGRDFICGGVDELRLDGESDSENRYILPDGYVEFLDFGPYNGFADWCERNGLALFTVGWDWRRPGRAAADFFLDKLLPAFEQGVAGCAPAPLDNFWIVGHSFGGVVAKHVLNRADNPYVQRLKGAITVGTPFYGYGGQLHRFLVGDSDLNLVGGGAGAVTRIGATLPASYELLFLDGAAYDANAEAFKADPLRYALTEYPCMDASIAGERADPYHPNPGRPVAEPKPDDYVRYLFGYDFNWDLLEAGREAAKAVSQPLDPSVAGKLWNIRGVQTDNNNPVDETVVGHSWRRVPAGYAPDVRRDPVEDAFGPGDGVIAAWSARLVGNPQVITIADDGVEHMVLMNHRRVQEEIAHILAPAEAHDAMVASADTTTLAAAVRGDLDRFIARLSVLESGLSRRARSFGITRIVNELMLGDPGGLNKLHARAFIDALKSPSQKLRSGRP